MNRRHKLLQAEKQGINEYLAALKEISKSGRFTKRNSSKRTREEEEEEEIEDSDDFFSCTLCGLPKKACKKAQLLLQISTCRSCYTWAKEAFVRKSKFFSEAEDLGMTKIQACIELKREEEASDLIGNEGTKEKKKKKKKKKKRAISTICSAIK